MNQNFMWANLVHLGSNMWNEEGNTTGREHRSTPCASPTLRFFRETWDAHMQELRQSGVNTLIIDVGESLKYESHPELAAEGAFTHDQMKAELAKLRGMGFEITGTNTAHTAKTLFISTNKAKTNKNCPTDVGQKNKI